MSDAMSFPATVEEFMEQYKIVDRDHIYSNGMEMVPIFRMKQWFEHEANHNAEVSKKEIIHCKDCKRQDTNNDFRSMWCHEIRTFVKPDEFCCWAEKRGEENGTD